MDEDVDWLPTRQSLLSRLRTWDDRESWNTFYHTYGRLLFRYAVKAGLTAVEAEDVVQDTVVSVAKEMPKFDYQPERGSFKGWLHQIVRRRVVDHLRRRGREHALQDPVDDAIEAADPRGDWESLWNAEWAQHVTSRAVARVKEQVSARQFQIFSLAVLQDRSASEVCRTLGVNAAVVYLARHRVGRLLRRELERIRREEGI